MRFANPTIRRRALLLGGGAAVALPYLPSLLSKRARAQGEGAIKRFVAVFFPNGSTMGQDWQLGGSGTNYTLGTAHTSLEPLRNKFSMFKSLHGKSGGAPDHSRGTAEFLTGAMISDQTTPTVDISIDQAIANALDPQTRIRSLHLGPEPYPNGPPADTGWPSGYNVPISWASPSAPNLPLESARVAFDQIYVPSGDAEAGILAARRLELRQSVLDHVTDQVSGIQPRLGSSDRAKLDEYLTSVRDIESRLQLSAPTEAGGSCGSAERPADGLDHVEHTRAMIDVLVLALRCDATRIITYSMDYGFGNKDFSWLTQSGFKHHNLSHSGTDEERVNAHKAIVAWYMEQFARLLAVMDGVAEGEATLLDNSVVYMGSDLGDAWGHSHTDLCMLLAGGGAGALDPGRLIDASGADYAAVLLALAHAMDAELPTFAGATSPFVGI
jgi:hypothetical protein